MAGLMAYLSFLVHPEVGKNNNYIVKSHKECWRSENLSSFRQLSMADNLPAKCKRTLNFKLTSEDNVHEDAVKRRQGMHSSAKTSSTSRFRRQASVEAIDDEDNHIRRNAGPPINPNSILEATDDELDEETEALVKRRKRFHPHPKSSAAASRSSRQASVEAIEDEEDRVSHNAGRPKNPNSILEATDDELDKECTTNDDEEPALQEETDEQELSESTIHTLPDPSSNPSSTPAEGLAIANLCFLSPRCGDQLR